MGDSPRWKLRPRESAHLLEYNYHQVVTGSSHEDYLDAPLDHVRAMVDIHRIVQKIEADQVKT